MSIVVVETVSKSVYEAKTTERLNRAQNKVIPLFWSEYGYRKCKNQAHISRASKKWPKLAKN